MDWTRRLRLRHFQLLESLIKTGSLSDTARQAHSTQPSLSKWLKELEDDIGAPLFERHARGLRPTPLATLMLGHVQRILSEVTRAQNSLVAFKQGSYQRIALGTSPASAPTLVPAAVQRFLHEYPKVQVELHEGTMNALLDRLERGQLDLVVGRLDNCTPRSTLRSETLYSERLRIVARPGHPLVSRDDLEWAELRTFDWITWPDGTPIRANFDAMLAMAGQQPLPYRVESMSLISNLWLLQYSDMLSIASDKVAEHFRTRGLVEPLRFDPECCGVLGMCWRDEAFPEPHLETLLGCMREAVSD